MRCLIKGGVFPSQLFFLTSGRAKLYTTLANGKVALIDFFRAPCFIGEMELIGHSQDIYSVQALETCLCLVLPIAECGEMLLHDPVFLREICIYLSDKNAKNIRSLTKNQSTPLENRLASFILLSSTADVYQEKHSHTADYLGVSYRHLLYVMAQFKGCDLAYGDTTLELVYDFVQLYHYIERDEWAAMVPSNIPCYLIAGDQDPCGNYGEGLYHVANMLADNGNPVSVKAYPGYRHEIHNELELRDEIEEQLTDFINKVI